MLKGKKYTSMLSTRRTFYISNDVNAMLNKIAMRDNVSHSKIITKAIRQYFSSNESKAEEENKEINALLRSVKEINSI